MKEWNISTQVLTDERQALEEAMDKATETGEPQPVTVDGKQYIVKDPGPGRIVEPA